MITVNNGFGWQKQFSTIAEALGYVQECLERGQSVTVYPTESKNDSKIQA